MERPCPHLPGQIHFPVSVSKKDLLEKKEKTKEKRNEENKRPTSDFLAIEPSGTLVL